MVSKNTNEYSYKGHDMKFSEYVTQLKEYEPESFIVITRNKKSFVYKGESEYDDLTVSGDGLVKIKEYLDVNIVGVEVFLDENSDGSNLFVLEILKMKHEKELKRKQKAQQDLEEFNEWWDKHEKEQRLELIACMVIGFLLLVVLPWLLSKMV